VCVSVLLVLRNLSYFHSTPGQLLGAGARWPCFDGCLAGCLAGGLGSVCSHLIADVSYWPLSRVMTSIFVVLI